MSSVYMDDPVSTCERLMGVDISSSRYKEDIAHHLLPSHSNQLILTFSPIDETEIITQQTLMLNYITETIKNNDEMWLNLSLLLTSTLTSSQDYQSMKQKIDNLKTMAKQCVASHGVFSRPHCEYIVKTSLDKDFADSCVLLRRVMREIAEHVLRQVSVTSSSASGQDQDIIQDSRPVVPLDFLQLWSGLCDLCRGATPSEISAFLFLSDIMVVNVEKLKPSPDAQKGTNDQTELGLRLTTEELRMIQGYLTFITFSSEKLKAGDKEMARVVPDFIAGYRTQYRQSEDNYHQVYIGERHLYLSTDFEQYLRTVRAVESYVAAHRELIEVSEMYNKFRSDAAKKSADPTNEVVNITHSGKSVEVTSHPGEGFCESKDREDEKRIDDYNDLPPTTADDIVEANGDVLRVGSKRRRIASPLQDVESEASPYCSSSITDCDFSEEEKVLRRACGERRLDIRQNDEVADVLVKECGWVAKQSSNEVTRYYRKGVSPKQLHINNIDTDFFLDSQDLGDFVRRILQVKYQWKCRV